MCQRSDSTKKGRSFGPCCSSPALPFARGCIHQGHEEQGARSGKVVVVKKEDATSSCIGYGSGSVTASEVRLEKLELPVVVLPVVGRLLDVVQVSTILWFLGGRSSHVSAREVRRRCRRHGWPQACGSCGLVGLRKGAPALTEWAAKSSSSGAKRS